MYLWGVIFAVLAGLSNYAGLILQKLVVNEVDGRARGADSAAGVTTGAGAAAAEPEGFFARLLRRPIWVLGVALEIGVGTVFFLLAQVYAGPALIPGLMASGLIALALGSAWLLHEPPTFGDMLGIGALIAAAVMLGLSHLNIDLAVFDILEAGFLRRAALFSVTVLALFLVLVFLGRRRRRGHRDNAGPSATLTRGGANSANSATRGAGSATLRRGGWRGQNHALRSGLLYVLSNFWVGPFTGTVLRLFQGRFSLPLAAMFAFTSAVLVLTNLFGIAELQRAFRVSRASVAVPVQMLPTQVAPAIVYLVVFRLEPPSSGALLLFTLGAVLIVVSSFLLGGRQEGAREAAVQRRRSAGANSATLTRGAQIAQKALRRGREAPR
jgi:hypothetical protein